MGVPSGRCFLAATDANPPNSDAVKLASFPLNAPKALEWRWDESGEETELMVVVNYFSREGRQFGSFMIDISIIHYLDSNAVEEAKIGMQFLPFAWRRR